MGYPVAMADTTGDLYRALGRLVYSILTRDTIGSQMSAFTDAFTAFTVRLHEDVAHWQDLLAQALVTETADQAEIDRLTAEAAAQAAEMTAAIEALNALDPDPSFPPVAEPPVEPPVEPSN